MQGFQAMKHLWAWLHARSAPPNWMHALTVVFQLSGIGGVGIALHRLHADADAASRRALDQRMHHALDDLAAYWRSGNNLNELSARLDEYRRNVEAQRRRWAWLEPLASGSVATHWADVWATR